MVEHSQVTDLDTREGDALPEGVQEMSYRFKVVTETIWHVHEDNPDFAADRMHREAGCAASVAPDVSQRYPALQHVVSQRVISIDPLGECPSDEMIRWGKELCEEAAL